MTPVGTGGGFTGSWPVVEFASCAADSIGKQIKLSVAPNIRVGKSFRTNRLNSIHRHSLLVPQYELLYPSRLRQPALFQRPAHWRFRRIRWKGCSRANCSVRCPGCRCYLEPQSTLSRHPVGLSTLLLRREEDC